jgi:hypothetical protein
MDDQQSLADLTVAQLRDLIRKTVQEAMVEVLIEISIANEYEAEVAYQAEMNDLLRTALRYGIGEEPEDDPPPDD